MPILSHFSLISCSACAFVVVIVTACVLLAMGRSSPTLSRVPGGSFCVRDSNTSSLVHSASSSFRCRIWVSVSPIFHALNFLSALRVSKACSILLAASSDFSNVSKSFPSLVLLIVFISSFMPPETSASLTSLSVL